MHSEGMFAASSHNSWPVLSLSKWRPFGTNGPQTHYMYYALEYSGCSMREKIDGPLQLCKDAQTPKHLEGSKQQPLEGMEEYCRGSFRSCGTIQIWFTF